MVALKAMPVDESPKVGHQPYRNRLPAERSAVTHKFNIAGHEGYLTVGEYPDGRPGEIFITMSKHGATMSGLVGAFATAISICLQYNVPLSVLSEKFKTTQFDPAGITGNPNIPRATSILDYVFRWLEERYQDSDSDSAEEPND